MIENTKLIAGTFKIPVQIEYKNNRIYFKFNFNRSMMEEIKSMQGAKWHGYDENPRKIWSVVDSPRNRFQLEYLKGCNPYKHYDLDIVNYTTKRKVYNHQLAMFRHVITRKHCLIAAEMGTGKTLIGIEVMEFSNLKNWWWVAPRSALKSVELELVKWESKVWPNLITYEGLRSVVKHWDDGDPAPDGIIFDESSRIKNSSAQRSQAAMYVANAIREEYGYEGYIVLMTGSPAPKSPVDWWHQCEVACPGYLKEGHPNSFQRRLGLIVDKESITGGVYPHLVTWKDDPKKCDECGEYENHENHIIGMPYTHEFKPSIDEVGNLYNRLKGLVQVVFKKDCLDLPDKIYRLIRCEPSDSLKRVAKTIVDTSTSTIKALTLLRELSDGFQYVEKVIGQEECELCHGKKTVNINEETEACPHCKGTGTTEKIERHAEQIQTPKEDALLDLLDEYEEVGRVVIYAGFMGSVDRCQEICNRLKWIVLRIDGRGWKVFDPVNPEPTYSSTTLLEAMDLSHKDYRKNLENFPKVAIVGNPQSGGMGLTLTASPVIIYYSNDFNAESRIQSEDRIHRAGMDTNRGATIIDLINLESDEYVLENLKRKRTLQSRSLGELREIIYGN